MGITCLLYLPSAPSTAVDHINERLTDDLDFTELDEPWLVTCRSYRDQVAMRQRAAASSGPRVNHNSSYVPKIQYLLTFGHVDKMFSMVATMGGRRTGENAGKGETGIVVEVDWDFELILAKLKNLWTKKQEVVVEGIAYEHGDYIIRIGSMRIGGELVRGLFVQAENVKLKGSSSAALPGLRGVLRGALQGIPGISDIELTLALHGRSMRKQASVLDAEGSANKLGALKKTESMTIPTKRPADAAIRDPKRPRIQISEADLDGNDWHEYAAVRLREDEFTRAHEAYQFFRLFRQEGFL
ncbi:hypothetical protein SpCBS45565_g00880 [Spizellomyces sp. 'palustris']|nr:hypothetical protein SpCBS45565_g00880 [Spizellomyces sp. 'palustris']